MVKIPTLQEVRTPLYTQSEFHRLRATPTMVVPFGSRLYGTSTPESDLDIKVLCVPAIESLLERDPDHLVIRLRESKVIRTGKGHASHPGDTEVEFISIYRWLHDLWMGQTYALEMAMWILDTQSPRTLPISAVCKITGYVLARVPKSRVGSMVGFADKQVWDYVRRGQAYKDYTTLSWLIARVVEVSKSLSVGQFVNGNERFQTELAKLSIFQKKEDHIVVRDKIFFNKASLSDLVDHVTSALHTFGPRAIKASDKDIDWNSLAHAYRCYQQALSYLKLGQFKVKMEGVHRERFMAIKTAQVEVEVAANWVAEAGGEVEELRKGFGKDVDLIVKSNRDLNELTPEEISAGQARVKEVNEAIVSVCEVLTLYNEGHCTVQKVSDALDSLK